MAAGGAGSGLEVFEGGSHDPAIVLLVETQAALRGDSARIRDAVDMLGGDALELQAPQTLSFDALDSVFARIDALETGRDQSRRAARAAGSAIIELLELPEPLREVALEAAGGRGWQFAGPGIKVMDLEIGSASHVQLLRIEPGAGAPRHDHGGVEHTLVVTGAFRDETGLFRAGDIATKQPGDVHRPVAEPGPVCFALAVSDAPPEFTGALGVLTRLLRRH
jgi:putative transcriptional regulator